MLKKLPLFLVGMVLGSVVSIIVYESQMPLPTQAVRLCFTPNQKCEPKIIRSIDTATKKITVYTYAFTSWPIAKALLRAKQRGVYIQIFVDKGQLQEKHSRILDLKASGIPVTPIKMPGIFHHKVMIIDEKQVITGSYNFTYAAENRNAENVLFLDSEALALEYLRKLGTFTNPF